MPLPIVLNVSAVTGDEGWAKTFPATNIPVQKLDAVYEQGSKLPFEVAIYGLSSISGDSELPSIPWSHHYESWVRQTIPRNPTGWPDNPPAPYNALVWLSPYLSTLLEAPTPPGYHSYNFTIPSVTVKKGTTYMEYVIWKEYRYVEIDPEHPEDPSKSTYSQVEENWEFRKRNDAYPGGFQKLDQDGRLNYQKVEFSHIGRVTANPGGQAGNS